MEEVVTYFFYFDTKENAQDFVYFLERRNCVVDRIDQNQYYNGKLMWPLIARIIITTEHELDALYDIFWRHTSEFHGVLDGHERVLF